MYHLYTIATCLVLLVTVFIILIDWLHWNIWQNRQKKSSFLVKKCRNCHLIATKANFWPWFIHFWDDFQISINIGRFFYTHHFSRLTKPAPGLDVFKTNYFYFHLFCCILTYCCLISIRSVSRHLNKLQTSGNFLISMPGNVKEINEIVD